MDIPSQIKLLTRGTTEVINLPSLEKKLFYSQSSGLPLRIKAGFDPTAPDMHLGHTVLLRKLRQFQDLGHEILFLIGDFTAQIGDPTGKDKLRPRLEKAEIEANTKTYREQVFKILDPNKTKVLFNSSWLGALSSAEILRLSRNVTVAQMLARADFKQRMEEGKEISILEFFYPLLQGYDSVHLKADVELGGSDQKFNLLMGRQLQEAHGCEPQVVMMTPLLEGLDGVAKMSKSLGNAIGINDAPSEMFGKVMSICDELMYRYYETLTDCDLPEIKAMHPKAAKENLAALLVRQFHKADAADKARAEFQKVFSQGDVPQDIETVFLAGEKNLADMLVTRKIVASKNEFRRLLLQGALTLDGHRLESEDGVLRPGVLRVGKKRFLRLV
ncbi:MAG: tyrosine--tRNA ligase [Candidatus Omnitrophica bacterium]|nr:tyrosine--tRNA ligase [Candidatus Omnitrophota bacterium]